MLTSSRHSCTHEEWLAETTASRMARRSGGCPPCGARISGAVWLPCARVFFSEHRTRNTAEAHTLNLVRILPPCQLTLPQTVWPPRLPPPPLLFDGLMGVRARILGMGWERRRLCPGWLHHDLLLCIRERALAWDGSSLLVD